MGVSPLKKKSAWKLPLPGIEARFCRRLTHKLFAIPALSISKHSDFSASWSLRKDCCPFSLTTALECLASSFLFARFSL